MKFVSQSVRIVNQSVQLLNQLDYYVNHKQEEAEKAGEAKDAKEPV